MSSYDVKISGGLVQTTDYQKELDIYIKGEKIALLCPPGSKFTAFKEIDAKGKTIIPGLIDLHTHVREPGYTHKEDFITASRAAAIGGVTLMCDQPNVEPPTTTVERFLEKKQIAEEKSIIDFGHMVSGVNAKEVEALAQAGVTGFKIFQVSGAYPHDDRLCVDDTGKLYNSFREISKTGLLCQIHPFNQDLFDAMSEEQFSLGAGKDYKVYFPIYVKDVLWSMGVSQIIHLQRETNARIHLMHTHSVGAIKQLREAKKEGLPLSAEADLKYFQITKEELDRLGIKVSGGGYIAATEPERIEEIWTALNDGTIDSIGSDHAPHTLEELEGGKINKWKSPGGCPQLEDYLSVLLTDVNEGRLTMARLVQLVSANPAKLLGIYPQKGAIVPGADADITIVDMEKEEILTDEGVQTKAGYTPYSGRRVKGMPILTMLRGKVIAENKEIKAEPGYGRYVPGKPNPKY